MGCDKALLRLAGVPLLARVAARLAPQCDGLAISRGDDLGPRLGLVHPSIRDDGDLAGLGPLAGILAGLEWVAAMHPTVRYMATAAVDTPFLPTDFVAELSRARAEAGTRACCARSAGRSHPVAALWPVEGRAALRGPLEAREIRRVGDALALLGAATVSWSTDPCDPFHNINTPEDAAAAERIARALTPA